MQNADIMSKILIVGSKNYSNRRIAKELKNFGLTPSIVTPLKFTLYVSDVLGHDRCSYNGNRIFKKDISGIVPRIGRDFKYGVAIVKHLNENIGVYSPSTAEGLKNASDKYLCTQLLSLSKLQVPKTVYSKNSDNYSKLIELAGGYPVVAKLLTGSQGAGVFILTDDLSGSTALSTISRNNRVLLQQYIETAESDGNKCDIRAWVVGDKVVASMKRFAIDKDFRSNYSISKTAETIELTEDQKTFAIECAKSVGLEFAGVDLMIDSDTKKVYCIEVNGNASLLGIEKVTGVNVANAIAKHMYIKTSGLGVIGSEKSILPECKLLSSHLSSSEGIPFSDDSISPIYNPDNPNVETQVYFPDLEPDELDEEDDDYHEIKDEDLEMHYHPITAKAIRMHRARNRPA